MQYKTKYIILFIANLFLIAILTVFYKTFIDKGYVLNAIFVIGLDLIFSSIFILILKRFKKRKT